MSNQQHTTTSPRLTRRSLVKGAAWAVPAVAVAAAAPKAAASVVCVPDLDTKSCGYDFLVSKSYLYFSLTQEGSQGGCEGCTLTIHKITSLNDVTYWTRPTNWTGSDVGKEIIISRTRPTIQLGIKVHATVTCAGTDKFATHRLTPNLDHCWFPSSEEVTAESEAAFAAQAGVPVEQAATPAQEAEVVETPAEAPIVDAQAPLVEPGAVVDSPMATG